MHYTSNIRSIEFSLQAVRPHVIESLLSQATPYKAWRALLPYSTYVATYRSVCYVNTNVCTHFTAHVLSPMQLLIVTLALYALLITVNALSVFLNDWARRGDVERIGLLQTINLVSGRMGGLLILGVCLFVCMCFYFT